MKKINLIWILGVILIVILLGFPRLLDGGRGSFTHSGYSAMMGYSMGGLFWLAPALVLILVIAVGVWLGNQLSDRERLQGLSCPSCSKTIESDWQTCPYCSESLK